MLASPALAEPKPPTEKDKQFAGELVKRAIGRGQAGDHSAAIEIYLQAYSVAPNSLLLSNIGAEFQQSGKLEDALHYFCMYLDKDPNGTNAPYATSQARALQIQLGNKTVDDRNVCAPRKRPPPPPPPPDPGPVAGPTQRKIKDDPPPIIDVDEPAPSGNTTLKYAGLVAGLAGLAAVGIGTYDGIQAKNLSDQITNHPPATQWPDNIKDIQRRGEAYEKLQIGFLVAGGVLITAGVVMFVVSRPDGSVKRPSDKAMVTVTPTANGFAVLGTF